MNKCIPVFCLLILAGCTATDRVPGASGEPESTVRFLCDSERYHEAMRELPAAMKAWDEYTAHTGRTAEGAPGYLYASTMSAIVRKGDRDWGAILDDPDIPYSYKTEMIFEIAEARLGKGASWSSSHTEVIVIPRSERAGSWEEVNKLLRQVLKEQGAVAGPDRSGH